MLYKVEIRFQGGGRSFFEGTDIDTMLHEIEASMGATIAEIIIRTFKKNPQGYLEEVEHDIFD